MLFWKRIKFPWRYRGAHWWIDFGWYKGDSFSLIDVELLQWWGSGTFTLFYFKIAKICFGIGRD